MIKALRTLAFFSVSAASLATFAFADSGSNLITCHPTYGQAGTQDAVTVSRGSIATLRAGNPRIGEAVRGQNYAVKVSTISGGKDLWALGDNFLLSIDLTKVKAIDSTGAKIYVGKVKAKLAGQNIEINELSCAVAQ